MPMDEIIRMIENSDREGIQDLIKSVISRYKELYPESSFLFISADKNAVDTESREILEFIDQMNQKYD